ncbi:MAG TPA: Ldh family oxidoreductase [Tepidisphaeraceae bacterium]|jgi:LDH2 family malate/lactate/ureidoglycolate dehydrogenase|nr:Ldh family oxidoreductase [Tepidisphaeraceae bacterium]
MPTNYIMPAAVHNELISAAYRYRGYTADEALAAASTAESASRHGIKTHNAIKALHLDEFLGAKAGGCKPGAHIEKLPSKYKAVARWNANRKLGQAVALEAMNEAMRLADEFGVGTVAVDNAFHYLWGGGYVIDAAQKGFIAYTCCTAALAEVVPFGGKYPTLGTNPHSWGFPTTEAVGFPICIDWATSVVAMGRVQQFVREGKQLPPGAGVDKDGNETTDPNKVAALMPFGAHKGYGLSLIDEILAGYIGGSLPTLRSRWSTGPADEKRTPAFFFQCMRPEAIGCAFPLGRSQNQNVKAVIDDIRGHGNDKVMLPGEPEARAAAQSEKLGGLIFTAAEIDAFDAIAKEAGVKLDRAALKTVEL